MLRPLTVYQLNRAVTPIPGHKLDICETDSADEALDLAGMVNSAPVQRFLIQYLMATSVSPTLRRIPLPKFDARERRAPSPDSTTSSAARRIAASCASPPPCDGGVSIDSRAASSCPKQPVEPAYR